MMNKKDIIRAIVRIYFTKQSDRAVFGIIRNLMAMAYSENEIFKLSKESPFILQLMYKNIQYL